jgi:aliphatic nitrilase
MVVGPTGDPVSEIVSDHETLLYAQIDLAAGVEPKQFHDVVGYYNRFDIFKLTVDRSANRPISFVASPPVPPDNGNGRPRADREETTNANVGRESP